MNEDNQFNENKPQMNADKRRYGFDFFGSLGKGMLAKENIETLGNSSGLTPLSFGDDIRNSILNNSSGLSPLRPFGNNHRKEVLE